MNKIDIEPLFPEDSVRRGRISAECISIRSGRRL